MQAAYREVMLIRVVKAKKQQLVQTQPIFEQVGKTGWLLAWLSREQHPIATIARIQDSDGAPAFDLLAINAHFASYYSALYSSKAANSGGEELDSFLGQMTFAIVANAAPEHLDSPITLEEVQQALSTL